MGYMMMLIRKKSRQYWRRMGMGLLACYLERVWVVKLGVHGSGESSDFTITVMLMRRAMEFMVVIQMYVPT